jgi:hypothetical protein
MDIIEQLSIFSGKERHLGCEPTILHNKLEQYLTETASYGEYEIISLYTFYQALLEIALNAKGNEFSDVAMALNNAMAFNIQVYNDINLNAKIIVPPAIKELNSARNFIYNNYDLNTIAIMSELKITDIDNNVHSPHKEQSYFDHINPDDNISMKAHIDNIMSKVKIIMNANEKKELLNKLSSVDTHTEKLEILYKIANINYVNYLKLPIILPAGYCINSYIGHMVTFNIFQNGDRLYTVIISNAGSGLEYHPGKKNDSQLYPVSIQYEKINEICINKLLFLINFATKVFSLGSSGFYRVLKDFCGLENKFLVADRTVFDKKQIAGTCAYHSMYYGIKVAIPLSHQSIFDNAIGKAFSKKFWLFINKYSAHNMQIPNVLYNFAKLVDIENKEEQDKLDNYYKICVTYNNKTIFNNLETSLKKMATPIYKFMPKIKGKQEKLESLCDYLQKAIICLDNVNIQNSLVYTIMIQHILKTIIDKDDNFFDFTENEGQVIFITIFYLLCCKFKNKFHLNNNIKKYDNLVNNAVCEEGYLQKYNQEQENYYRTSLLASIPHAENIKYNTLPTIITSSITHNINNVSHNDNAVLRREIENIQKLLYYILVKVNYVCKHCFFKADNTVSGNLIFKIFCTGYSPFVLSGQKASILVNYFNYQKLDESTFSAISIAKMFKKGYSDEIKLMFTKIILMLIYSVNIFDINKLTATFTIPLNINMQLVGSEMDKSVYTNNEVAFSSIFHSTNENYLQINDVVNIIDKNSEDYINATDTISDFPLFYNIKGFTDSGCEQSLQIQKNLPLVQYLSNIFNNIDQYNDSVIIYASYILMKHSLLFQYAKILEDYSKTISNRSQYILEIYQVILSFAKKNVTIPVVNYSNIPQMVLIVIYLYHLGLDKIEKIIEIEDYSNEYNMAIKKNLGEYNINYAQGFINDHLKYYKVACNGKNYNVASLENILLPNISIFRDFFVHYMGTEDGTKELQFYRKDSEDNKFRIDLIESNGERPPIYEYNNQNDDYRTSLRKAIMSLTLLTDNVSVKSFNFDEIKPKYIIALIVTEGKETLYFIGSGKSASSEIAEQPFLKNIKKFLSSDILFFSNPERTCSVIHFYKMKFGININIDNSTTSTKDLRIVVQKDSPIIVKINNKDYELPENVPGMYSRWAYNNPYCIIIKRNNKYKMLMMCDIKGISNGIQQLTDAKIILPSLDIINIGGYKYNIDNTTTFYSLISFDEFGLNLNIKSIDVIAYYLTTSILFGNHDATSAMLKYYPMLEEQRNNENSRIRIGVILKIFFIICDISYNSPFNSYYKHIYNNNSYENVIANYKYHYDYNILKFPKYVNINIGNAFKSLRKFYEEFSKCIDINLKKNPPPNIEIHDKNASIIKFNKSKILHDITISVQSFLETYKACSINNENNVTLGERLNNLEQHIKNKLNNKKDFYSSFISESKNIKILILNNAADFYKIILNNIILNFIKNFKKVLVDGESCNEIIKILDMINVNEMYSEETVREPEIVMFEVLFGHIIKKEQYTNYIQMFSTMTDSRKSKKVYQMLMGKGKTSVITPLLAIKLSQDKNKESTFFLSSSHLIKQSYDDLIKYNQIMEQTIILTPNEILSWKINQYSGVNVYLPKRLFIVSDNTIKSDALVRMTIKKNVDKGRSALIIDEFDSLYNPLKTNYNIPVKTITLKESNPFNKVGDENYFNNFLKSIINYYYDSDDFSKFKDNLSEQIEIRSFDKKLVDALYFCVYDNDYNLTYGFGTKYTHSNLFYAVPYDAVKKPSPEALFSDLIYTIIFTILSYLQRNILLKRDYLNAANKIKENSDVKHFGEYSDDMAFNIISQKFGKIIDAKYYDNIFSNDMNFIDSISNNNIDKDKMMQYIINVIVPNTKYTLEQRNCNFIDIINKNMFINKVGFTGTVNLDLPIWADEYLEFTVVEKNVKDMGSMCHVFLATSNNVLVYDNLKTQDILKSDNILVNICNIVANNMYSSLIDSGAFLKDYEVSHVVAQLDSVLGKQIDYIIFLKSNSEKCIFSRITKEITSYTNKIINNCFIYYDNSHVVGIDIKQPSTMLGLVTISQYDTFTTISQAMFRLRNLNYGHQVNFIINNIVKNNMSHIFTEITVENLLAYLLHKNHIYQNYGCREQLILQNCKFLIKEKYNFNDLLNRELILKNIDFYENKGYPSEYEINKQIFRGTPQLDALSIEYDIIVSNNIKYICLEKQKEVELNRDNTYELPPKDIIFGKPMFCAIGDINFYIARLNITDENNVRKELDERYKSNEKYVTEDKGHCVVIGLMELYNMGIVMENIFAQEHKKYCYNLNKIPIGGYVKFVLGDNTSRYVILASESVTYLESYINHVNPESKPIAHNSICAITTQTPVNKYTPLDLFCHVISGGKIDIFNFLTVIFYFCTKKIKILYFLQAWSEMKIGTNKIFLTFMRYFVIKYENYNFSAIDFINAVVNELDLPGQLSPQSPPVYSIMDKNKFAQTLWNKLNAI